MYEKQQKKSLDALRGFLHQYGDVPDDEWRFLSMQLASREFSSEEFLLRAGERVDQQFFIVEGLVRIFYRNEDDKELNRAFVVESNFTGSLSAFLAEEPSRFYIQAIEPTLALLMPQGLFNTLYRRHPMWEHIGRRMAESLALQLETREAAFALDKADARYQRFLLDLGPHVGRIPTRQIAAYVGVSESTLRKLRSKAPPVIPQVRRSTAITH